MIGSYSHRPVQMFYKFHFIVASKLVHTMNGSREPVRPVCKILKDSQTVGVVFFGVIDNAVIDHRSVQLDSLNGAFLGINPIQNV